MSVSDEVLESFHRVLLEEIESKRPEYLNGPFTVAEIYQDLVPYSTHRDRIGVEINGDYEDALIRLLSGEGGFLILESEHALRHLRRELETSNPNTGVYREFAAVDVRLDPARVPTSVTHAAGVAANGAGGGAAAPAPHAHESDASSQEQGRRTSGPDDQADISPTSGGVADREAPSPAEGKEAGEAEATCRWCRASLPAREQLRFCPYCGTDVRTVPCPGCGEELEPDWRFCIACGTEAKP